MTDYTEIFRPDPADDMREARIDLKIKEHSLDFGVFDLLWRSADGSVQYGNSPDSPDEPTFTGTIKWDGCSHFDFHPDGVAVHWHGLRDALFVFAVVQRLFVLAAVKIPRWMP